MPKRAKIESHRFFCINCGREGIPISRSVGQLHGEFHRKKLYCPWCKLTINMVECRNDQEVYKFKEAYEKGEFKDEVEESIRTSRVSGVWQEFLWSDSTKH